MADAPTMEATLSSCGRYRYDLTRRWSDGPLALWIMLNPSTADNEQDDPTIRRVIGFTKHLTDAGGVVVGNLFALRATDPAQLFRVPNEVAVGPENAAHLERLMAGAYIIVCAWGSHRAVRKLQRPPVVTIAKGLGRRLYCLGTTQDGRPRHPLYVKSGQPFVPFPPGTRA